MEKFRIVKIKDNLKEWVEDVAAEEIPLTISIQNKEITTLLCSPQDINDLIYGYLYTSGIIRKPDDILNIKLDKKKWIALVKLKDENIIRGLMFKRLQPPGCGKGVILYMDNADKRKIRINTELKIKSSILSLLMNDFQKRSEIYLKTGGTHSAGLADKKKIIVFREDIGRHNAVDKIIGYNLINGHSFKNKILLLSGRISSEIIDKIKHCLIPVIVSISAPTNEAVKQAREMNLTLVGFARGKRMNLYSGEARIV